MKHKYHQGLEIKIVSFLNKGIFTKALEFRFYLEKGNYIGVLMDLDSTICIRKYMKGNCNAPLKLKCNYTNQLYTKADIEITKPRSDIDAFKFQVVDRDSTLCTMHIKSKQFDSILSNIKVID